MNKNKIKYVGVPDKKDSLSILYYYYYLIFILNILKDIFFAF